MIGDDDTWVREDDELRPARRQVSRLGDEVATLLGRRRWGDRLRGAVVFGRWHELVGADLAAHCEPVRLARGVLTVRAENAAWATEVRYLSAALVRRSEQVLGAGLVHKVDVVVGRLEGLARPPADGPPPAPGAPPS